MKNFTPIPLDTYCPRENINQFYQVYKYMINWGNDAHLFCPPFDDNTVLCIVTKYVSLPNKEDTKKQYIDRQKKSIYNFPSNILKKYFDESLLTNNGNSFLCYVGDVICSRSQLTETEYLFLIENMNDLEYNQYYQNILKVYSKSDIVIEEYNTAEMPYVIYLGGADDTSYSILASDIIQVDNILKDLSENPTFDTMSKYKYYFSN